MTPAGDLTGQEQSSRATPVLLKCHPIMSTFGLCRALKGTPQVVRIGLMLSGKIPPVPKKGPPLLLPNTPDLPLPVGGWRSPSTRPESWHTPATILIIPALAVVNDGGRLWLEQACLHRSDARKAKLPQLFFPPAFAVIRQVRWWCGDLGRLAGVEKCKILSD